MAQTFITPEWPAPPGVRALVTTRAVGELDALAQGALPLPATPRWLRQVHGINVADLDALPAGSEAPEADASVTSRPRTVCVVRTADCLPVLFATVDGTAVAATHAGWRGLAAGVLEATVAQLRRRVRAQTGVLAWLGPGIGPGHFEVGDEVRDAFLRADAGAGTAFSRARPQRWMCDLYMLARRRLSALGITSVWGGTLCTYSDEERFYSHRRDVQHRGLDATGRMASLIWLEA